MVKVLGDKEAVAAEMVYAFIRTERQPTAGHRGGRIVLIREVHDSQRIPVVI